MQTVHQMEFSPLGHGKRTENWMIQHFDSGSKLLFTFPQDRI